MSIGKAGGSYARTDKTENYIGDAIQYGQEVSYRNRQLKQEQNQIKNNIERQRQNDLKNDFEEASQYRKENPFVRTKAAI